MKRSVLIILFSLAILSNAQSQQAGTLEKTKFLNGLGGQVDSRNFNKIAFTDFSKFLIGEDNQFGRAVNYASIQVDKPRATLNLYQKTGQVGFFNFLLSGGFENDLFSVVSNKKPASSFSGTLSYSWLLGKSYWFYPSKKHVLWSRLIKHYDSIDTKQLDVLIKQAEASLKNKNETIEDSFYVKNADGDEVIDTVKHAAFIDSLLSLNQLKTRLDSLTKEKKKRTDFVDSIYLSAEWSTRKWFYATFAGNYGGVSYKHYNRNSTDQKLLSDVNSFTRSGTVSLNFLFKTVHPAWYRVFNNTLTSAGVSFERKNNFASFKSSEYKAEEKTDSTNTNTQYTRTQTYTVYTDALKEYNSITTWIEFTKLFGKNGIFGLRNRLAFENPQKAIDGLNQQTNWEIGLLFNTTSKKDKDVTKFSVEIFSTFKDLRGNNVKLEDRPQKWSKRHTIGVRTNIPFRFLSL